MIPLGVSTSDIERAILEVLPDFPSVNKMNEYCRGEWVPHDEDCFGTQREAEKAFGDSLFFCSAPNVSNYSISLSGRGWCVDGWCDVVDISSSSGEEMSSSSEEVSSSSSEEVGSCPSHPLSSVPSNPLSACFEKNGRCYKCNSERGSECSNSWLWIYDNFNYDGYWYEEISCDNKCPDGAGSSTFSLQKKSVFENSYNNESKDVSYEVWGNKTKFYYDALGRRTQAEPNTRRYLFEAPRRGNRLTYSDHKVSGIEVWENTVKDSKGNNIQLFIEEDKAKGLRRDSTYYSNGSWDVFEFDDAKNETRYKASSGASSLRKYDDKGRLKERYMFDGNGNALTSEKYEWENGRLVRMVANGVERKYIYGKTMRDTVKVVPTDKGFSYHSGYDGTVGKMPEEGEPGYEIFAMEPYGHVAWKVEENRSSNSGNLNVLSRISTSGCVTEEAGMPRAQCLRYGPEDFQRNDYQKSKYGWSDQDLYLEFRCECNADGKYQALFNGESVNEMMEIYMSFWVNGQYEFYERCRVREEMQRTYWHEVEHIENGRYVADRTAKSALQIGFNTKRECEDYNKITEEKYLRLKWEEWKLRESNHANVDPASPKEGDDIHAYDCH